MKSSATDKFLAAALFTLTVVHATSHFSASAQAETQAPATPCNAANQPLGKQLEVYGQIVQIESNNGHRGDVSDQTLSGEVRIALNTAANCQIDAVVANQEWQSWSRAQQEMIALGTLVEIGGHIRAADGRVVLEVNQPPNLH
jgi:hypothetical protein